MSESDTKPTPPSGMPAALAAKSDARPSLDEISAPRNDASTAILAALEGLHRKVDNLAKDDEQIRLDFRRLEQRQAGTDEEVRLLREEVRKDRESRNDDKASLVATYEAMQRFVEASAKTNNDAVERVMKANGEAATRFDAATQRFDAAVEDVGKLKSENETQNRTLAEMGLGIKTLIRIARSPRVMAYVAIGAMVGGAMMAIAEKVMK